MRNSDGSLSCSMTKRETTSVPKARSTPLTLRTVVATALLLSLSALFLYLSRIWEPLVFEIRYFDRPPGRIERTHLRIRRLRSYLPSIIAHRSEEYFFPSGMRAGSHRGDRSTLWKPDGTVWLQSIAGKPIAGPPWLWGVTRQEHAEPPPWFSDETIVFDSIETW